MTEIEMFAAIGRKQTELDNLHVEYNRLLSVLGSIAAGDVSRPVGHLTYTQMLNPRGGIECDLTVARVAEHDLHSRAEPARGARG